MRVLHFTHTFVPQYGGTTTRLLDLLPLTGDQHYLYVRPPPAPAPQGVAAPQGVVAPPDEDFGPLHVRRRGVPPGLRPSRAGAAFAAQLVDDNMDLVHGHNPPQCAWASLIASRRLGVPFVYEAHRLTFDGVMDQAPGPPFRHPIRVGRALVREGVFFYAARAIIVQTVRHRARVLSLYPGLRNKIHVVPVHVDTAWFDRTRLPESQPQLKQALGFRSDATTFLYCGHLSEINGVLELLAAWQAMDPAYRARMQLVVLGQGPLQADMERAAAQYPGLIDFRGLASFEDMPRYYAAADVVVAPSRPTRVQACNNPTKLLEAMAMQRPVLGSDVGGIRPLVRDGESGFLYRAGDVPHLAERMRYLVDNPQALATVGERARALIVQEHGATRCAQLLADVYRRALQ